jgi:hypothetical protein
MARAGSVTAPTTVISPADGGPFLGVRVICERASLSSLEVRIPELTGTDWTVLEPGESELFSAGHFAGGDRYPRITRVELRGLTGDALARFRVTAL